MPQETAEAGGWWRVDTHLWARVGLPIDDLGRGVQGAPAERLQELAVVVEVGEAEVSNLQGWVNAAGVMPRPGWFCSVQPAATRRWGNPGPSRRKGCL